jgi:two-component sensor histidine kinase
MTARDATSVSDHQARLSVRLEALARASEAPRLETSDSLALEEFLVRLLEPFGASRFNLRGPRVAIPDSAASMLGLAVHELATNAVKYGALSLPTGNVAIAWKFLDGTVTLRWKEKGGPPVIEPTKRGFGSKLLDVVLRDGNGGAILHFEPSGLVCIVTLPATAR